MEPSQLPPGSGEQLAKTLRSYRDSKMVVGVEILPGPGCEIAEAQVGTVYSLDNVPVLPFPDCERSPCCGCCYIPVVYDETGSCPKRMSMTKKIFTGFSLVWAIVVIASLLLGGCATFPPSATAWVSCQGQRCDVLWSRAQVWIANYSAYRIQIANENIIQTYGPLEGRGDVAYSVTKERQADGGFKIYVRGHCYATVYGCFSDPAAPTNALYSELMKP